MFIFSFSPPEVAKIKCFLLNVLETFFTLKGKYTSFEEAKKFFNNDSPQLDNRKITAIITWGNIKLVFFVIQVLICKLNAFKDKRVQKNQCNA